MKRFKLQIGEICGLNVLPPFTYKVELDDGADGAEQRPMAGEFHVMEWHLAAEVEELRKLTTKSSKGGKGSPSIPTGWNAGRTYHRGGMDTACVQDDVKERLLGTVCSGP